jgi:RNA polymerase sigma-70 factor (ECF subfamily)
LGSQKVPAVSAPTEKRGDVHRQQEIEQCTQWLADYGDDLLAYALTRVHDLDVAEDLVQETYLAAFQAVDRFEGRSSARTWLIGILRNKVADFFRRKSRQSLHAIDAETASPDELFNARGFWQTKPDRWTQNPACALENEEFWRVFDECRAQLPPAVAIAFVLRELDQLATDEICATLDISRSAFSVRMHRARAALRACLERHWFST